MRDTAGRLQRPTRGLQAYWRASPEAGRANPVRPRHGGAGDTPDIRQVTAGEGPGRADGGDIPGPAGDRAAPGGRHPPSTRPMKSCTASCRASTRSSGFRQSTQALLTALWSHRCPWTRYSASSTAARWPGTTPSSTIGVPCSCCLVRSGLATPERSWRSHEGLDGQLLVQYRGRTIPTQEAPPRPGVLRASNGPLRYGPGLERRVNGVGSHPKESLASLDAIEADSATLNGGGRVRKPPASPRRKPTPRQRVRWKAVQQAKLRGLSIRAIARGVGYPQEHGPQVRRSQEPAHDAHQGQVPRITVRSYDSGLDGHFP